MVFLGIIFILGGGQMLKSAFQRQKITGIDIWGKTDHSEPLSVMGIIMYVTFGLAGIGLGLNYVIRYWNH